MPSPRDGFELPPATSTTGRNNADIPSYMYKYASPPAEAFPKAGVTPATAPATMEPPTVQRNSSSANSDTSVLSRLRLSGTPHHPIEATTVRPATDPIKTAASDYQPTTRQPVYTQEQLRNYYYDFTDQYGSKHGGRDDESHFSTTSDDNKDNHNVEEETSLANTMDPAFDAQLAKEQAARDRARNRHRKWLLVSNLLFVLGSILYIVLAVEDWKWGRYAVGIPDYVLMADDDATWTEWETRRAIVAQAQAAAATKQEEESFGDLRRRGLSSVQQAAQDLLGGDDDDHDVGLYDDDDDGAEDDQVEFEQEFANDDEYDDDDDTYNSLDEYTAQEDDVDAYKFEDDDGFADSTTEEEDDNDDQEVEDDFLVNQADDGDFEQKEIAELVEEQMEAAVDDDQTEERRQLNHAAFDDDGRFVDPSVLHTAISLLRTTEEENFEWTDDEYGSSTSHEGGDDYYIDDYIYLTAQALDKAMQDEQTQDHYVDRRQLQPARIAAIQSLTWIQLSLQVRQAANVMGWNRDSWDARVTPFLMTVSWSQLSATQRDAATILGYTAETWIADADAFDWADSPTAENTTTTTYQEPKPMPKLLWSNYSWQDLPDLPRQAAETLGYNATLWNLDLPPLLVTLLDPAPGWPDLSYSQKQAAMVLGYEHNTWWHLKLRGTQASSAPSSYSIESAPTVQIQDWHANFDWDELPTMVRAAFQVLGFTDEIYDKGHEAPTDRLKWWQLSEVQRQAAASLGYSQTVWNARFEAPQGQNGIMELGEDWTSDPIAWETYKWKDLPPDIQDAYGVLGWEQENWDHRSNDPPESETLNWDGLSEPQQLAASYLGYSPKLWNNSGGDAKGKDKGEGSGGGNDGSSNADKATIVWDNYDWDELPDMIRKAYETLGYNENNWTNGGQAHTDALAWSQLSEDERLAASSVGYSQRLWDMDSVTDGQADDDYVFFVSGTNTWVSKYMMIYFAAALCFCAMGVVDWIRERRTFHVCMVLAGLFGLMSSMLVETSLLATNIFNSLSVHFFLLEGVNIIWFRIQNVSKHQQRKPESSNVQRFSSMLMLPSASEAAKPGWWIPKALWAADVLFVVGALLDVILSYCYYQPLAEHDWSLSKVFLFSTVLWLVSALLYSTVTILLQFYYQDESFTRAIYEQDLRGSKTGPSSTIKDELDEENVDDDATASILPHPESLTNQREGKSPCLPGGLACVVSPTETMDSVQSCVSVGTKASAYDLENISPLPQHVTRPHPDSATQTL